MSERASRKEPAVGPRRATLWSLVAGAVGVGAWLAGSWLLGGTGGRTGLTGGMLLLVVALAALGVAVASRPYGPDVEGSLDLSTRLGVGALGGALGGVAAVTLLWILGAIHITSIIGVALGHHMTGGQWAMGAWNGVIWGILLGLFYPLVPGRGPMTRSVLFSVVPSLWMLLRVLPSRGLGVFGVHLGAVTFLVVGFINLGWGVVEGACLSWAASSDLAPVDRLPGEA